MSLYHGLVTLDIEFYSAGGVEADQQLAQIALAIVDTLNEHIPVDELTLPVDGGFIAASHHHTGAYRA